jgi:hypothetical protein
VAIGSLYRHGGGREGMAPTGGWCPGRQRAEAGGSGWHTARPDRGNGAADRPPPTMVWDGVVKQSLKPIQMNLNDFKQFSN